MKHGRRVRRSTEIRRRLRKLLVAVTAPMILIITALLVMLMSINASYRRVLENASIAADFSLEFKETIDQKMYTHVIQPRNGHDADALPMEELDDAVTVLERLEGTTTLRDNRWRIRSMLNMCENLRGYMLEIANCEQYDTRMELLERNIRGETGLTVLIETYMNGYINDEVREMARIQATISSQMTLLTIVTVVTVLLVVAVVLLYSLTVSRRISKPITELVGKVKHFGETDMKWEPIQTGIIELNTLDRGFDEMADRIRDLMDRQIEDQRSLHRAELELLQAQINPHFLYNTLDSIAILAEMERNDDVVNMVTSLSVFFRNSLSRGRDIITLQTEREQVASYLEIQQIRYSDILTYEISIDESILDRMVPKLILQPLVENALYHGIKNKRALGRIRITGKREGDDIILSVHDNGAGMDEEHLAALRAGVYEDRKTGLGLVNVHKRIRLYCGEPYGLTFDSTPGEGTCVSVRLPADLHADEKETM